MLIVVVIMLKVVVVELSVFVNLMNDFLIVLIIIESSDLLDVKFFIVFVSLVIFENMLLIILKVINLVVIFVNNGVYLIKIGINFLIFWIKLESFFWNLGFVVIVVNCLNVFLVIFSV